jgi:uncharacterized protein (DUF58 family)
MAAAHELDLSKLDQPQQLHLLAKAAVNRLASGLHRSRINGPDLEFSQYRTYQAGDDPRSIDWKVYARRRKFYLKQALPPQRTTVSVVLDDSASMNHRSQKHTKWDYARWLGAQLGLLALAQQDDFSIQTSRHHWPLGNSVTTAHSLISFLSKIKAEGSFVSPKLGKTAGLQVYITDLYEEDQEWKEQLEAARSSGPADIWLIHVMAPEELDPELLGKNPVIKDLETGSLTQLSSQELAKAKQAFSDWQQQWRLWCQGKGIAYFPLVIDQIPQLVLAKFLALQNSRSA